MAGNAEKIIEGAIALLAEDRGMSMAAIARRLGIGRTTLYRSFADRAQLVEQVRREGARRLVEALEAAAGSRGTGLEMLEACCERLFEMEPELSLVLAEHPLITGSDLAAAAVAKGHGDSPSPIDVAVGRGHEDGSIDAELPVRWVDHLLWATLVAGRQFAEESGSRHRALGLVLTTMRRAVGKAG